MPVSKIDILLPQIERCLLSDVITRSLGADSSSLLSLGEAGFSTDESFLLVDGLGSILLVGVSEKLKI